MYYYFCIFNCIKKNELACFKYCDIDFKKKSVVRLIRKSKRVHEFPIDDVLIDTLDKARNSNEPIFPSLFNNSE